MEQLGYPRDGVTRFLGAGKTNSLGLVLPGIALPYSLKPPRNANADVRRWLSAPHRDHRFDLQRERDQLKSLAERRVDALILMSVEPEQRTSSSSTSTG